MNSNKIDNKGDNSVIIQGSTLENCNITTNFNEKKFFEFVQAIALSDSIPLTILVITITQERLNNANFNNNEEINLRYGENYKDWQPFKNERIIDILYDFQTINGFKINVVFVECQENTLNNIFALKLKLFRYRTIAVIDCLALDKSFSGNRQLAKIFDVPEVGGCLIPFCKNYSEEVKFQLRTNREETLPDLSIYLSNFSEFMFPNSNTDLSQIELEIPDKNKFLQKLLFFAVTYFPKMGIKVQRVVVIWDDELKQYQNISEKTSHLHS